ncbi:RpiB/LacA/LacB family sugar-phosphate isomerase [Mycoplasmopsis synoviae]|uniref:Ribose 5-phosphate isomerase B n=2 Tax=Mycoplasmopsis synoviae TaxID=2109 RepID=Q4A617_MYCS5|nr:RpiB/LacA/LacB family sugar-phosphate isomerase [Mycoplasmopsis synoviae]AAZ43804.1 ribose 5-phosphate isomerase B [Mycoplasmopsis synoviae 53]AKB11130.1 ribose 5-phosphate isomerase [Mycoplasmopsis synoviae ATCC 25204]AKJ20614.1 Ribose 5-phosphate isomerase B [Mycoplasmopsis synoviae]AQU47934.1 Ribose 5-phosphate isomerase B [Mycoplasmopsis synoviae]AWL84181.1 ribose-5-phosphate isomerase [Mycoplasmopsis synoviae]
MNKVIPLASDHAGFELKERLEKHFQALGYKIVDLGAKSNLDSDNNYALAGHDLAHYMLENKCEFGIGICGTGLGISYALNRHNHIRAARVTSNEDAHLAKLHNDANVLVFGARQVSFDQAKEMIENYINTTFEGGRHLKRINDIDRT